MTDHATVIGESVQVTGHLSGSEDLRVFGAVEGTIDLNESLIVEPSGLVQANVRARNVIVSGVLIGDVEAADVIELTEQARLIGNISAPRVIVMEGAALRGRVAMTSLTDDDIPQPMAMEAAPPVQRAPAAASSAEAAPARAARPAPPAAAPSRPAPRATAPAQPAETRRRAYPSARDTASASYRATPRATAPATPEPSPPAAPPAPTPTPTPQATPAPPSEPAAAAPAAPAATPPAPTTRFNAPRAASSAPSWSRPRTTSTSAAPARAPLSSRARPTATAVVEPEPAPPQPQPQPQPEPTPAPQPPAPEPTPTAEAEPSPAPAQHRRSDLYDIDEFRGLGWNGGRKYIKNEDISLQYSGLDELISAYAEYLDSLDP